MASFDASLRAMGDVRPLAATVQLEDGQMNISAGDTEIGSWPLTEIEMEPIPTGYRMVMEGDQILVELKDLDGFADELKANTRRPRRRPKGLDKASRRTRRPVKQESAPQPIEIPKAPDPPFEQAVAARQPTPEKQAEAVVDSTPKQSRRREGPNRLATTIDRLLTKAEKRWGSLLPKWVFSRGMLLFLIVVLGLLVAFPGVFSVTALVLGLISIVLGGVVYTDSMLASRLLPGRATPAHVMIIGVALVLVGVLLGMIAK